MKLLLLATPACTSQYFHPVTSNPLFSFQCPPAHVADISISLHLLAVQATQVLQDITHPNPFPRPTATTAEANVRLPPFVNMPTSLPLPHATNNHFSVQRPPAPVVNASMRLPPLAVQAAHRVFRIPFLWPTAREASAKLLPLATQTLTSQTFLLLLLTPFSFSVASSSRSRH